MQHFTKNRLSIIIAAAVGLVLAGVAEAADWTGPLTGSNHNWNVNGNWDTATFPNAVDEVANFQDDFDGGLVEIEMNQAITIGTMNLDDTGMGAGEPNGAWEFNDGTASGLMIFDVSSGNAAINLGIQGTELRLGSMQLNDTLVITAAGTTNIITSMQDPISGTGGLTLDSSGNSSYQFRFGDANTYTGLTTLLSGRLAINNGGFLPGDALIDGGNDIIIGSNSEAIDDTSIITITANGGRLDLNGRDETIGGLAGGDGSNADEVRLGGGTLTIADTLAPGQSVGEIDINETGSVVLTGNAEIEIESLGSFDTVDFEDNQTFDISSGTILVSLLDGYIPDPGDTFNIFLTNGFIDTGVTIDGDDNPFVWQYNGNGQIEFVEVPEPATAALLALGGLALMRRRRNA